MKNQNQNSRLIQFSKDRNLSLKKISYKDFSQGFNFYLCGVDNKNRPKETPIFVKFRNGKSLKDKWVWVELINNQGKPGWLYQEAHFIFMEVSEGFLVVPRASLLAHVKDSINFNNALVSDPWSAKYNLYQPKKKLSKLTLVKLDNLHNLADSFSWFDLSK